LPKFTFLQFDRQSSPNQQYGAGGGGFKLLNACEGLWRSFGPEKLSDVVRQPVARSP
jgi:hypothetical protein